MMEVMIIIQPLSEALHIVLFLRKGPKVNPGPQGQASEVRFKFQIISCLFKYARKRDKTCSKSPFWVTRVEVSLVEVSLVEVHGMLIPCKAGFRQCDLSLRFF